MIQSASNPDHDLTKKHVAISFHVVPKAIAAGIIEPHWLKGAHDMSDIMTKQIPSGPLLVIQNMFAGNLTGICALTMA